MIAWIPAAFARDVELKVHDMKGVVTGEVVVELGEPGQTPTRYTPKDDGVPPDALAGDHLYTGKIEGLTLDHGSVTVRAGDRAWQGGFRFEEGSDPVLLVGLEERGFAAASTHEVMFVPQEAPGPPPGTGEPAGAPPPGAPPPGGTPGSEPTIGRRAPTRTGPPEGMWLGWGLAAVAVGGLGAIAWAGAGRTPRIPPVIGAPIATTARRGPYAPADDRTDLWVGPAIAGRPDALRLGEGRWTPAEIALAALRVRSNVRVVVTDRAAVEAEGDPFDALAGALSGVADLLVVEG